MAGSRPAIIDVAALIAQTETSTRWTHNTVSNPTQDWTAQRNFRQMPVRLRWRRLLAKVIMILSIVMSSCRNQRFCRLDRGARHLFPRSHSNGVYPVVVLQIDISYRKLPPPSLNGVISKRKAWGSGVAKLDEAIASPTTATFRSSEGWAMAPTLRLHRSA
jgi:hypothetical protein